MYIEIAGCTTELLGYCFTELLSSDYRSLVIRKKCENQLDACKNIEYQISVLLNPKYTYVYIGTTWCITKSTYA